MDWGTALVGVISILICIVPFVGMYYKRVKNKNKMLQSLKVLEDKTDCKISHHEFCGDFVLGIDETRNYVFFFKQKKEEAISKFVDLSEVQACQVVKNKRNIEKVSFTERVELNFIPTNKSKKEVRFELFDEAINMQLSGELQFADNWSKKINGLLKNKK